ncbi:unannotated protein [freshwater metagenome]|uniref:Unannotated protein n=1 Tax=freshwater metagenome TaxID=449393 RepID=A0A6J7ASY5_9ZZZZ
MRTAESVVFTCWPPAPDERNTSTRSSFSSISTSLAMASKNGATYNDANAVWRLPSLLNGEMRTRRWTPCSARNMP